MSVIHPDPLADYMARRDFSHSPEPEAASDMASDMPCFVIQKHEASNLHYDFRLEADGVLKSWAVPKGPSTDPRQKRLAVSTEDHPLDYAEFEGVIPEHEYGGGAVLIWDAGIYQNITKKDGQIQPMAEALNAGHALIRLDGQKLKGGYVLHRIATGDDERWLLIKMDDDAADPRRNPVSSEPASVASGRKIEDIKREEVAE